MNLGEPFGEASSFITPIEAIRFGIDSRLAKINDSLRENFGAGVREFFTKPETIEGGVRVVTIARESSAPWGTDLFVVSPGGEEGAYDCHSTDKDDRFAVYSGKPDPYDPDDEMYERIRGHVVNALEGFEFAAVEPGLAQAALPAETSAAEETPPAPLAGPAPDLSRIDVPPELARQWALDLQRELSELHAHHV